MSNEQYKEGYSTFANSKVQLSNEQIKQMSSTWRAGYRAAQSDAMKKSAPVFPTMLYDVPKRPQNFVPTWSDILAATKRPRFNKLHAEHMSPVLNLIIKSVEDKSHMVKRYKDVVALVDEAFDIVLQYGYDEGILTEHDCSQYNYTPTK